jgi:hypothetical protein
MSTGFPLPQYRPIVKGLAELSLMRPIIGRNSVLELLNKGRPSTLKCKPIMCIELGLVICPKHKYVMLYPEMMVLHFAIRKVPYFIMYWRFQQFSVILRQIIMTIMQDCQQVW